MESSIVFFNTSDPRPHINHVSDNRYDVCGFSSKLLCSRLLDAVYVGSGCADLVAEAQQKWSYVTICAHAVASLLCRWKTWMITHSFPQLWSTSLSHGTASAW